MKNLILGIDPGFSGAIAWYNATDKKLVWVLPMPLTTNADKVFSTETRVEVDLRGVVKLLRQSMPAMAVVERVNASPKMGVTSAFRFGEGFGGVSGVLAALGVPMRLVYPNAWKAALGLSADKEQSRILACKLFPEWNATFMAGKKSADLAEAALLAAYGEKLSPSF